jgi:AcrR family transcriptional regulator
MMVRQQRPRPVQARVNRNSDTILDAALMILSNEGWGELTISQVARESALSPFTIRSRAPTPGALAAWLWRDRLAPVALDLLASGLAELECAGQPGEHQALELAGRKALTRTPEMDAIAEILVIAYFDAEVAEAVDESLSDALQAWCTPSARLSPENAARAAYAVSLTIGLLLMSRYPWARDPGLDEALRLRGIALSMHVMTEELPEADASHMDVRPILAADDEALDLLLNAALESISRWGFDATTVKDVTEAAGYSEGLAFGRYRTKMALFIDATSRQEAFGWRENAEFMRSIECKHGLAVAEAIYFREALAPGRRSARVMTLEQLRLSWHNITLLTAAIDVLRGFREQLIQEPGWGQIETEADFFLNTAAPLGALLLPRMLPEAFTLPWNAVTVPLFDVLQDRPAQKHRS